MYISNSVLITKSIYNIRRSPHMSETLTLYVSMFTPKAQLQKLEDELTKFVMENGRDYHPKLDMFVDEIQTPNETELQGKLRVRLCIYYRSNFQDGGRRTFRRSQVTSMDCGDHSHSSPLVSSCSLSRKWS